MKVDISPWRTVPLEDDVGFVRMLILFNPIYFTGSSGVVSLIVGATMAR